MKRCGELLREFNAQGNNQHSIATHEMLSQREAAKEAGMSEYQELQSIRIANVSDELFDSLVESDAPPTLTQLAELGKKNNGVIPLKNEKAFAPAIHFRALAFRVSQPICKAAVIK